MRDSEGKRDVRKRVATGATGQDKFNRSALPKIMQVKKWGMKGNTKYTHLVDQDTTNPKDDYYKFGGGGHRKRSEQQRTGANAAPQRRR